MGGPRAATMRQIERGQRCWSCHGWIGNPLPAYFGQQRRSDQFEPRRHRVKLNFSERAAWAMSCLAEDGKPLGKTFYLHNQGDVRSFVERAGGDLKELDECLRAWRQGTVWLNLTDEQYEKLIGRKQPRGTNRPPPHS